MIFKTHPRKLGHIIYVYVMQTNGVSLQIIQRIFTFDLNLSLTQ